MNFGGLNGADAVIIAVILLFGLFGLKKGAMKSLVGIVSLAASIVIARLLYPIVSDILNGLGASEYIADFVFGGLEAQNDTQTFGSSLPKFMADAVQSARSELNMSISSYAANIAVGILAFASVAILSGIIIKIGIKCLNIFSKLPVIGALNRAAGFFLGVAKGIIIVYFAVAVIFGTVPAERFSRFENSVENSVIINKICSNKINGKIFMKNSVVEGGE